MWGKWIEAHFDDERKTHFDMYDSPEQIFNLGVKHDVHFKQGEKIVELRFRAATSPSDAEEKISGIEGMVVGV